uniref:Endothelin-like toxin domain-containing protein n=1 Tax=Salmo trutta TaxID=8032 RepID=A0A674E4H4_SALTR
LKVMECNQITLLSLEFGLPLSERPKSSELAPPHRVRTKRCACNNQLDSECHYFCHLDIIWVNTPSKTTVYGLGSPLSRRRRSAGRCVCADSDDHTCTSFCQDRLWNVLVLLVSHLSTQNKRDSLLKLFKVHKVWSENIAHFSGMLLLA